jgi:hypothetical protein
MVCGIAPLFCKRGSLKILKTFPKILKLSPNCLLLKKKKKLTSPYLIRILMDRNNAIILFAFFRNRIQAKTAKVWEQRYISTVARSRNDRQK